MPGIVDADTHVLEPEEMWGFFDKEMYHRRPVEMRYTDPETGRSSGRWLIDRSIWPHPPGKGGASSGGPPDPAIVASRDWKARALLDINARLEDADKMGVDVQVVFPTLFIQHLTWDSELDVALARAYNRFVAEAWKQGGDRLRWVAVLPFLNIEACIQELRWCKEHGAVGFLARGIEGDRVLAEPYFFPVYHEASRLDMPLCIHTGPGCPAFSGVIDTRITGPFVASRTLPIMAAQTLISNRIPEQFPDLRIGFIETGASWVPYVLHHVERDWGSKKKLDVPHLGPDLFRDYRMFVACESDEDIPYLAQIIGEDHLITGTDYGHHGDQLPTIDPITGENRTRGGDTTSDLAVVGTLQAREDLSSRVVDKILRDNPRRFYGL